MIASYEKALPLQGVKDRSQVTDIIVFGDEALPAGLLSLSMKFWLLPVITISRIDALLILIPFLLSATPLGPLVFPKGACLSHRSSILMNIALTTLMHQRSELDTVVIALPCRPRLRQCGYELRHSERNDSGAASRVSNRKAIMQSIQDHKAPRVFEGVPTMYMFMLNHPEL